ncbi:MULTISPECIES: hypothetical protein [Vibrio]|nr:MULTISPECIES: hypothetical protein [Vibrio]NRB69206.1 hypothetical protein [Vibrio sp.]
MISTAVKQVPEYQDLHQLQLIPAMYTHADNSKYFYPVMVLGNILTV